MRKAKEKDASLLSLKLELAITILMFTILLIAIILAFIVVFKNGNTTPLYGQAPTSKSVINIICQLY